MPAVAASSLLAEGLAMLRAVGSDLAQLPSAELLLLADQRLPPGEFPAVPRVVGDFAGWQAAFDEQVQAADGVLLIAPETGGVLHNLAAHVESLGGRLLSPASRLIKIAADKQLTAEHLVRAGVPTPPGHLWRCGDAMPPASEFPAILKPVDGCGSQEVQLLSSASDLPRHPGVWRIEAYQPGLPASVAVLCGPGEERIALPACSQRLTKDGQFQYLGGETPLPTSLDARARSLALQAVAAVASETAALGYLGVDLVLGQERQGSQDVVIEVNPRLTTSYVGLRAACRGNLGEALLRVALGEAATVDFRSERIEFDASGAVRRLRPN